MITINQVRETKEEAINLLVTYSSKLSDNPVYTHITYLAPPKDLYNEAMDLKSLDKFNVDYFQRIYAPQYIKHIIKNGSMQSLFTIVEEVRNKVNLNILCYCSNKNEHLCHRSILLGILQGYIEDNKLNTKIDRTTDYSNYYRQYLTLLNNE